MKFRREESDFLTALESLMNGSGSDCAQDLTIICDEGRSVIKTSRLIFSRLISDELIPVLQDWETCLVLPETDKTDILWLLKNVVGNSKQDSVLGKDLRIKFPWINWELFHNKNRPIHRDGSDLRTVTSVPELETCVKETLEEKTPIVKSNVLLPKQNVKHQMKKVQCLICGKVLCDKHSLKKHADAVHFNIRRYPCDFCQKRFSIRNDLRDHVQAVHNKVKGCVCDICGQELSTRHGLRVHKLLHKSNTKSIPCVRCDKSFRHMCTYRKHIARVHEFDPEKRLKCVDCGKLYNHKEGLARHMKKFHPNPDSVLFKCNLCNSEFIFNYDLNRHKKRFHPAIEQQLSSQ